jgi:hypothetical protein
VTGYSVRQSAYLKAFDIAGAAIETSKRSRRLKSCFALLQQLDPDKPPSSTHAREFRWQYRALRERVQLYSERLAATEDPDEARGSELNQTEWAIELSLTYFRDVLAHSHPDLHDDATDQDP